MARTDSPVSQRWSIPILVTAVAVSLVGAWFVSRAANAAQPPVIDGAGSLTIGEEVYEFVPTACVISSHEFVAAGTGSADGDRFWVSASTVGVDLAVGTTSEIEQPDADHLWLVSTSEIDWRLVGDRIVATMTMVDRHSTDATPRVGELELRCVPRDA